MPAGHKLHEEAPALLKDPMGQVLAISDNEFPVHQYPARQLALDFPQSLKVMPRYARVVTDCSQVGISPTNTLSQKETILFACGGRSGW